MSDTQRNPEALYSTRARLAITAVLALAAAAFGLAVWLSDTGVEDDAPVVAARGAAPVDGFRLRPGEGTQFIHGSDIGVDLQPGWEARLVVEGIEIPEGELRRIPGQNQVFFRPGPGQSVERLRPGRNCVTAIIWRSQLGRGVDDDRITWCFQAV